MDLEHKHEVLTHYFNQRNSELQKQLGLQMARLDDAEQGSESTAKKLSTLCDELEAVKSENKTLKHELEEQVCRGFFSRFSKQLPGSNSITNSFNNRRREA